MFTEIETFCLFFRSNAQSDGLVDELEHDECSTERPQEADADSKKPAGESEEISRRQFFKAAGRGSTALGGMILLGGAGLTMVSASCGGDDISGPNGY